MIYDESDPVLPVGCSIRECDRPVAGMLIVTVMDRPGLAFRNDRRTFSLGLCAEDLDRAAERRPAVHTDYQAADGGAWRGGRDRRYR